MYLTALLLLTTGARLRAARYTMSSFRQKEFLLIHGVVERTVAPHQMHFLTRECSN